MSIFPFAMKDQSFRADVESKDSMSLEVGWDARLSALVEGTSLGCSFCAFFLDKFFGNGMINTWSKTPQSPWYLQPLARYDRFESAIEKGMRALSVMPNDSVAFVITQSFSKYEPNSPQTLRISCNEKQYEDFPQKGVLTMMGEPSIDLHVYAIEGTPAKAFWQYRPPNPAPSSTDGLLWARDCLSTRVKQHGRLCLSGNDLDAPILTSRVLEVRDGKALRLHEAVKNERGRYCALSYVWGEEQDLKMTRYSLAAMSKRIDISDLPATIVDAVKVTRGLQIPYLWTDALCILQDSKVDWNHEIAHMGDIYRNAEVTIIAGKASNVKSGFLKDYSDPSTKIWKNLIPIPFMQPDGSARNLEQVLELPKVLKGTIFLAEEFTTGMDAGDRDPTTTRPWCLQEALLSSRTLTYGRWTTWKCNKSMLSDGGFYRTSGDLDAKHTQLSKLSHRFPTGCQSKPDLSTVHLIMKTWQTTVSDYSRRKLSVPEDRLVAIDGIASHISEMVGVIQYVAGMWECNLLHDLMWHAYGQEWLARPPNWRAPTWSWASVEGPVFYDHGDSSAFPIATASILKGEQYPGVSEDLRHGDTQLMLDAPITKMIRHEVLKLLDDQNMSPPPPRSGRVQDWDRQIMERMGSRLHMETGRLEPAPEADANNHHQIRTTLPNEVFAAITFSHDFRIFHENRQDVLCFSGLLLKTIGRHYERIGCFRHEVRPWLDLDNARWQVDTITVV